VFGRQTEKVKPPASKVHSPSVRRCASRRAQAIPERTSTGSSQRVANPRRGGSRGRSSGVPSRLGG